MPENTEVVVDEPVEIPNPAPELPAAKDGGKPADAPKGDDEEATPEQQAEAQEKGKSRRQRQLERARTAAAVSEAENKILREEIAKRDAKAAPAEKEAPRREDFADYEAYQDARTDFRAEQKAAAIIEADRKAQAEERAKAAPNAENQELAKNWTEREKAFQATATDYQEVVTDFVQDPDGLRKFSDGARRLIVESDVGPQVLHFLGNDRDEADRISALSPVRQIAEIGKLESKFDPIAAKPTSKAPAPPTPPKSSKAQSGKDFSKMSIDELDKAAATAGSRWAVHH